MNAVDSIHNTLYSSINNLVGTLSFCPDKHYAEVLEIESLYNKHVLKMYTNFTTTPNEENGSIFIDTLLKYSIVDKWNKLSEVYKVKPIKLPNKTKKISNDIYNCSCGGSIILDDMNHTFTCDKCGEIKQCVGILDNKITSPNGKTTLVKNNYKHKTYFTQIYKNIFALEIYKFDENKLEQVKLNVEEYCLRKGIQQKNIYCSWLRKLLGVMKLSEWFPHINLLKKEITGYYPPRLTQNEESKLTMYYTVYTKLYDKIYKKSSTKKSYLRCEYIIDKILDQFLEDGDRKREILRHITLPQKNTLEKLDIKYENICLASEGILLYKPTLRLSC